MRKLKMLILASLALPGAALAAEQGSVIKALRPQLRTFDAQGQPLGQIKASELKLPTPIIGYGVGASIGIKQGGDVVYLRGLDVQTDAAKAVCTPVQGSARTQGSSYAASNMGLGGAADCKAP